MKNHGILTIYKYIRHQDGPNPSVLHLGHCRNFVECPETSGAAYDRFRVQFRRREAEKSIRSNVTAPNPTRGPV